MRYPELSRRGTPALSELWPHAPLAGCWVRCLRCSPLYPTYIIFFIIFIILLIFVMDLPLKVKLFSSWIQFMEIHFHRGPLLSDNFSLTLCNLFPSRRELMVIYYRHGPLIYDNLFPSWTPYSMIS